MQGNDNMQLNWMASLILKKNQRTGPYYSQAFVLLLSQGQAFPYFILPVFLRLSYFSPYHNITKHYCPMIIFSRPRDKETPFS